MLSICNINVIESLFWNEVEVRSGALEEFLYTGKVNAEIVCRNDYGARFTAAKCSVCGAPEELLSLCKKAYESKFEYITIPINMFKVE